jgi:hypothetical protein
MVKQSAPDRLRDYADENRLFHCTEVSVLYLVVLDAYTKGLPSGAVPKIAKAHSDLRSRGQAAWRAAVSPASVPGRNDITVSCRRRSGGAPAPFARTKGR